MLTDFCMASSVCTPSRAALLTGCHPKRISFTKFEDKCVLFPGSPIGLNPEEMTLGRMFKENGYATCMVGKWHVGDQPEFLPLNYGFDSYLGIPYSNDMGMNSWNYEKKGFPPLPLVDGSTVVEQQPYQENLTERYVQKSLEFIGENKNNPFFLYFAHLYVHEPLYCQPRFMERSRNGAYGGAVACIDWALDVLAGELERLGISDNTILIFTSDNGSNRRLGGSNLPLRGGKGSVYEGGYRVPMIIKWPGRIPAGRTCNAFGTAMDILPTLASLCGFSLRLPAPIDGSDVSRVWLGEEAREERIMPYYLGNDLGAVRQGRWKLILNANELFDLDQDPMESNNLFVENPDVVRQLMHLADQTKRSLGHESDRIQGREVRPCSRVANPRTLTCFSPDHPYAVALYD